MTSLTTAVNEYSNSISDETILNELSSRVVTKLGRASGAEISGVLLSAGLLSLIEDQKNATGVNTFLRNICIALSMRFLPDGEVDLGNSSNVQLLDSFLSEPSVVSAVTNAGKTIASIRESIMSIGQTQVPEFSNLRIVDIRRARA